MSVGATLHGFERRFNIYWHSTTLYWTWEIKFPHIVHSFIKYGLQEIKYNRVPKKWYNEWLKDNQWVLNGNKSWGDDWISVEGASQVNCSDWTYVQRQWPSGRSSILKPLPDPLPWQVREFVEPLLWGHQHIMVLGRESVSRYAWQQED